MTNSTKPRFKQGDKIQLSGGGPGVVARITNVQTNTDGRGNIYNLEWPDGEAFDQPVTNVDPYASKNAREFDRQVEKLEKQENSPAEGF